MEKRIELEMRGKTADQVTDLNLDNCRSTSIVGLTDEFVALETLSLINVGLTSLKGFPSLPNLKKLELSDNRISNGLNHLTTSPKLTYLNLSGNKIKDLETLKPLESFQNLEILDLFNNEATTVENYREKIFAMLPSLKYLDGFDSNEVEASSEGGNSDEEEGNKFLINGLEIDLNELNAFEKILREKKPQSFEVKSFDDEDDLDALLSQIKLEDGRTNNVSNVAKNNVPSHSDNNTMNSSVPSLNRKSKLSKTTSSIALLMCTFMSILSLANYAFYGDDDEDDGEEDDEDEDEDDTDEDENDVSLAEVYNDDLEEDNSEWDEENEGEDDEDELTDEEEEGDEAGGEAKNADTPEESQARGKKRKHDDDDNEKDG